MDNLEIVVVRHPDAGTDVAVFVDGVPVEACVTTVDPGYGHTSEDWQITRGEDLEGASPAAASVISQAFDRYAKSCYID